VPALHCIIARSFSACPTFHWSSPCLIKRRTLYSSFSPADDSSLPHYLSQPASPSLQVSYCFQMNRSQVPITQIRVSPHVAPACAYLLPAAGEGRIEQRDGGNAQRRVQLGTLPSWAIGFVDWFLLLCLVSFKSRFRHCTLVRTLRSEYTDSPYS
jgi:hypothetical protein